MKAKRQTKHAPSALREETAVQCQGSVFHLYSMPLSVPNSTPTSSPASQQELHCRAQKRLTPMLAEAGPAELHSQVFILL